MNIATQNLDHLGLVAGMCSEIGIADLIDQAAGTQATNKHLTYGQCVQAMILNGLGFIGRTLYMYSEYFEDKPVDLLLGVPVRCDRIDDNVLGRTLDKLFSLGVTDLFTKIALKALSTLKIEVKSLHLDSTSFHVDGEYHSPLEQEESRIQLVPGYSRDHRPELNQAVLQLISSNQGNLPLFMQAASGNSADKSAFAEIVSKHVESLQKAVEGRYLVGDSALYTPKAITELNQANMLFVTRVPMQIKEAREATRKAREEGMTDLGDGYRFKEVESDYGGFKQRWIVLFSEAAYIRECKTLIKTVRRESEKEAKDFEKLCKRDFSCKEDAQTHVARFVKELRYTDLLEQDLIEQRKHSKVGRPKKGEVGERVTYSIRGKLVLSEEKKRALEESKGFFVLATNDLNREKTPPSEVLSLYKSQQSVEGGFRFLKSPDFLVSSFFLKKPERIEALLMVMTLCLLVYAAIEHKARQKLQELGENFLDQKKKPSQRPTARWIFFCFLGLHVVIINGIRNRVTNLKDRHRTMLMCLGPLYQRYYYSEMW